MTGRPCLLFVAAAAAMGQLYKAEKRYWILEPDAALIIVLVLIPLVMVYLSR